VKALPDVASIAQYRVEQIASPVTLVLKESDSIDHLLGQIRLLEEHPVPVVDKAGRLVGAVGLADLGRVLWRPLKAGKGDASQTSTRPHRAFAVSVGTIMHSPAVTVPTGTSAAQAARRMSSEAISSVFVIDGGRPTGIVSQADLLGLAVGHAEPGAARGASDVYVQIHGLRGNADPELLAEIDQVIAQGMHRISRHVQPLLLNLNIAPHQNRKTGGATVQARLHTDQGIFYASETEWNYFAGIAGLMDDLSEQVQRAREESRDRKRGHGRQGAAKPDDEVPADPELEARLRRLSRGDGDE
jgi:CBS domain-containing protein/ribosome-associated translation inhibitor RaiA